MTSPQQGFPNLTQKEVGGEVTYNDFVRMCDALVPMVVQDVGVDTPPVGIEGYVWIIGSAASWPDSVRDGTPSDGQMAQWYNGAWYYITAVEGYRVINIKDQSEWAYIGGTWTQISQGLSPGVLLGGTTSNVSLTNTPQKVINYTLGGQWNWSDDNDYNAAAGEITVPKSGIYRITAGILGTQNNTNKEEDLVLELDVDGVKYRIAAFAVATDKGARVRQLSATLTRQLTADEVLSLHITCTASGFGTLIVDGATFEIDFTAEANELVTI